MPRIRTIKPEFCTSEQVADCSPTARLLFVTSWMFCDDAGRHPWSAKRLKMEVFPGDSFTTEEIEGWLDELWASDLIASYHVDGKRFFQVTGWSHQKIEKPSYKHPEPQEFDDRSATSRRPVDDSSPPDRSLPESTGEESKGRESGSPVVERSTTAPPCAAIDDRGYRLIQVDGEVLHGRRISTFPIVGEAPHGVRTEPIYSLDLRTFDELERLFPNVDVMEQIALAESWLIANPKRRKTRRGMPRFLHNWMAKAVNGSAA